MSGNCGAQDQGGCGGSKKPCPPMPASDCSKIESCAPPKVDECGAKKAECGKSACGAPAENKGCSSCADQAKAAIARCEAAGASKACEPPRPECAVKPKCPEPAPCAETKPACPAPPPPACAAPPPPACAAPPPPACAAPPPPPACAAPPPPACAAPPPPACAPTDPCLNSAEPIKKSLDDFPNANTGSGACGAPGGSSDNSCEAKPLFIDAKDVKSGGGCGSGCP